MRAQHQPAARKKWLLPLGASLLTGSLVCIGINLQQIGLIFSTAGKGGFITGLYVILDLVLAFGQALVCGLLSLAVAVSMERIDFGALRAAASDLAYGGIVSVGIGFTLQVAGQKYAKASHAAIIIQFEAVFAVLAGWIFLGEVLTPRGLAGCGLMFAGMLVSGSGQANGLFRSRKNTQEG